MITEAVVCLVLHCSRCNTVHTDEDGGDVYHWTRDGIDKAFPAEPNLESLRNPDEEGWRRFGDRILCGDCQQWDENADQWREKGPLRGVEEAVAVRARLAYTRPDHVGRRSLAVDLLNHIDEGIPGSPIRYRGEQIWLHTTGQVEGWLRLFFEEAGLVEPADDDFEAADGSRG